MTSAFRELREAAMAGKPLHTLHRSLTDGLLEHNVPEAVVRAAREQAEPGIALFELGDSWSGSRVGGTPRLPRREAWPRDENGAPLTFVAALELAELPGLEPLPATGTLLVYWSKTVTRVLWAADGVGVGDADPPSGIKLAPPKPLTGALMPLLGELDGLPPAVRADLETATGRHQLLGPARGGVPDTGWRHLLRVESEGSHLQLLIPETDLYTGRFDRIEPVLTRGRQGTSPPAAT